MKTRNTLLFSEKCLFFGLNLLLLAGISPASATVVISAGEVVQFNDTFTDNASGWTNVAVVNAVGTPTSAQADISGGNWQASILADSSQVTSVYTAGSSLDIANGPISLYTSVRVDNITGDGNSRFRFEMNEASANPYFSLSVYPNSNIVLGYRDFTTGSGAVTTTGSSSGIITNSSTYYTFKFTLSAPGGVTSPGTLQTFYYNGANYVSLGSASNVKLTNGTINTFQMNVQNGPSGGVYYDDFVVTQAVPEPSVCILIGLGALGVVLLSRRRIRKTA